MSTPLQEETDAIEFFKANFTTNPKKLKKLAAREEHRFSEFIQKGLIASIKKSPDPVGYLRRCFKQIVDFQIVTEQLIADGHHGMLVLNDVIYPVTLETNSKWLQEHDKWTEDDELLIHREVVANWMDANKIGYFYGKVVLFTAFGFSGMPGIVKMRAAEKTEDLVKIPGSTRFYKRVNAVV